MNKVSKWLHHPSILCPYSSFLHIPHPFRSESLSTKLTESPFKLSASLYLPASMQVRPGHPHLLPEWLPKPSQSPAPPLPPHTAVRDTPTHSWEKRKLLCWVPGPSGEPCSQRVANRSQCSQSCQKPAPSKAVGFCTRQVPACFGSSCRICLAGLLKTL